MSHAHILELPVRCLVVQVRRLTPFHWALLRALQHFPAGTRPSLAGFAERLGLSSSTATQEKTAGESAPQLLTNTQAEVQATSAGTRFPGLSAAWTELLERHAVDSSDFQDAGLTMEGQDALRLNYFPQAPAEEQQRFLHLDLSGHPRPYSPPLSARSQPLDSLPAWHPALTSALLAIHLRSPACSSPLSGNEELQSAHPLWPEARLL